MDECLAGYPPAFHFFPFWWPTSTSAIGIVVKTMSRCQMAVGLKSKTWSGARRGRSQASTACRWKGCWSCQWAQPKDFIWGGKIQGFWRKKNENKLKMNIEFPGILVNIFDEGRNSLSLLLFLLIIRVVNLYPDHQGRRPNNEDRAAHRTVSCPWEGVRPVHIFTVRTIFKQIHSCLCLKFPYKRFWTGTAVTLLLIGSKITFLRWKRFLAIKRGFWICMQALEKRIRQLKLLTSTGERANVHRKQFNQEK